LKEEIRGNIGAFHLDFVPQIAGSGLRTPADSGAMGYGRARAEERRGEVAVRESGEGAIVGRAKWEQ
jgi:hypothetical protein